MSFPVLPSNSSHLSLQTALVSFSCCDKTPWTKQLRGEFILVHNSRLQSIMWEWSRQELKTAGHFPSTVKSREKGMLACLLLGLLLNSYHPGPRQWARSSCLNSTMKKKSLIGRLTGHSKRDDPSLTLPCLEILRLVRLTIKANHWAVHNHFWSLPLPQLQINSFLSPISSACLFALWSPTVDYRKVIFFLKTCLKIIVSHTLLTESLVKCADIQYTCMYIGPWEFWMRFCSTAFV